MSCRSAGAWPPRCAAGCWPMSAPTSGDRPGPVHAARGLSEPRQAVAECGALAAADLIVCEGSPGRRCVPARWGPDALRRLNATAALVLISPFGQTGPQADEPATDLTLFFASGIARMLTGQVDDLAEAPIRPVGEQSAFIGGLAAACAGMHAALPHSPARSMDVSIQEALATMAMTELARAGLTGRSRSRKRVERRQRRHGLHPAGARRLRGDLAARGAAMGGVAGGDGLAGLGQRSPLRHQGGPRRQLGCAARADVGVEPRSTTSNGSPTRRRPRMCRAFRCASRRSSWTRRSSRIAASGARSRSAGGRCRCRARRSG